MFSTLGGYHENTGECSVQWGDTMSTLGDTMMSVGGYHEYTRGCSVQWGFHTNSIVFAMTLPHIYHDIPQCTEHPQCTHDIPHCTHDIPLVY